MLVDTDSQRDEMTPSDPLSCQATKHTRTVAFLNGSWEGSVMHPWQSGAEKVGVLDDSNDELEVYLSGSNLVGHIEDVAAELPSLKVARGLRKTPLDDPERQVAVELIRQMGGGDEEALMAFYERFSPVLYGMALKMLRDENESEDVLQETFIHLWKKAALYDSRLSSPSTWAVMILRNKAIDRLRSRQRADKFAARAAKVWDGLPDYDEISAEQPLLRERRVMVRTALMGLSSERRQVVELAFFSGLTHEEIAQRLGIPLGTIKTRIRRALIELRDLVGEAR